MALSDELLAILRCPRTHSPLTRADDALVTRLNQAISANGVKNLAGEVLQKPLRGALLNADRTLLYPVYDHGPTLIVDQAVNLIDYQLRS